MKVIFITAGGVEESGIFSDASYITSLADAVFEQGADVAVISPAVFKGEEKENKIKLFESSILINGVNESITVYKNSSKRSEHITIKTSTNTNAKSIGKENILFNAAACDVVARLFPDCDVILTDGTTTAASQIFMRYGENRSFFKRIRSVHMINTLHKKSYIKDEDMRLFPKKEEIEHIFRLSGKNDLNRAAIICADRVILPSVTYCTDLRSEAREPRYCHTVRQFGFKFKGIDKGININKFDPFTDKFLEKNYGSNNIQDKITNKLYIQRLLGFKTDKNIPLLVMFCREKTDLEYSLITAASPSMRISGVQLLICLESDYENADIRSNNLVNSRTVVTCDPTYRLQLLAGSDICISAPPSSPSGIDAAYACRYGSIPVVFSTGGLKDKIKYYDRTDRSGNGFTFNTYNSHDMLYTLWDALGMYRNEKEHWLQVTKNAMKSDHSLERNASTLLKYISK